MSLITNPEGRDPLAQSARRPAPSLRTPSRPADAILPPEEMPASPTEQIVQEAAMQTEAETAPTPPTNPIEGGPEWLANALPQASPGIRPIRLRPLNLENPVVPDIDFESDAEAWQRISDQAASEGFSDDIIFSQTVRDRIADSNNVARGNGGEPYAPVINSYDWIAQSTEELIQEQRTAFDQAVRPVGVRPDQGMLGVGRNVLQGRPFSPVSQQVVDEHFSRVAENNGFQTRIGRFVRNLLPDGIVERAGLNITAPFRGAEYAATVVNDVRRTERQLLEQNPEYRTVGRRALDELARYARPAFVNPEGTANRFRSVTDRAPLLEALAEESPAFRQLMTELAPTLDAARQPIVNPMRGQYGEFGSAGTLSAGLYLLNMTGGAFTGAIYEAAGSVRDVLGRVNPQWAPPTRTATGWRGQQVELPTSPNVMSPFLGRDIGFTQRYTRDRYLSTIDNPALRWLPRRGQIALGFALDVAADPDGLITRPVRNIAARSVRATAGASAIVDALSGLDNAVLDLPNPRFAASVQQTFVRPTTEGVESVATEAVMPTVRFVDDVPVQVDVSITAPTRRPAARGGNIITVDDLLNRVETVINRVAEVAPTARSVPDMGADEGVQMVQRTTRNYEMTLQSAVREANLLASGLSRQDFQTFASNVLNRVRQQGVDVSDTGAITLRNPNVMLDTLVTPIRAELSAPLYRNYSDLLDMYRANPTAIPPQAYQLVRRTNTDIVNLAKTWEVLPNNATASSYRITQLRTASPEFGSVWGSPIDSNIGAPIRRVVEVPRSGLYDTPEVSRMVASQPPITIDVETAPINQVPPPADIEQRLRSIQTSYAQEVERYAQVGSPSQVNKVVQRMADLRKQGAELIADYPEVAMRITADAQPTPNKYAGTPEYAIKAAQADLGMRFEHGVLNDLQRQLGIVAKRVEQQQQLLDELPPLERRFLDSEIDTRRLHGEDVPIRTINTPSTISNETIYPAARKELFDNDALLPINSGSDNDIRTVIETNSELSTLPRHEALEVIRNSVEIETFKAFDVNTNEELSPAFVTMDSLIEFNLDRHMMINNIEDMPLFTVFDEDTGDMVTRDGAVLPRAEVFEAYENVRRGGTSRYDTETQSLVINPLERGTRYLGEGAYGKTFLQSDGTVVKRGTITTDEIRIQRKAAAQGIAPEVLSEYDGSAKEFTMQFLDGYKTLSDLEMQGDLGADELLAVELEVYKTIDRLHQAGIVHNDIHNNNIMVNPDTLEVRIIDFGLAENPDLLPGSGIPYADLAKQFNRDGEASVDFGRVQLQLTKRQDDGSVEIGFIVDNSDDSADLVGGVPARDLRTMSEYTDGLLNSLSDRYKFVATAADSNPVRLFSKYEAYHNAGFRVVEADGTIRRRSSLVDFVNDYAVNWREAEEFSKAASGLRLPEQKRILQEINPKLVFWDELQYVPGQGRVAKFGPGADFNALTDYRSTAVDNFRDALYHGTHHTSILSDADVFSLSNEFGPSISLTRSLERAEMYAKAYPSQDVVTTSYRTPRREQIGNVQTYIIEPPPHAYDEFVEESYQPASAFATEIRESFVEELQSRGETKLVRNFKNWIRSNDDPAHWWHYLRERFTDDNMTEYAKIALGIRDRMVEKGVRVFKGVRDDDVIVIDPSVIIHRSVPHHVESTGTVAEALANRIAVDADLTYALPNKTTQAINEHNKLNMDTYIQNQLTAAYTQQQREVLEKMRVLNETQLMHQESFINNRLSAKANEIAELEKETNRVVSMELKNINEPCL